MYLFQNTKWLYRWICCWQFVAWSISAIWAQAPIKITLQGIDTDSLQLTKLLQYEGEVPDSLTAILQLQDIISQLQGQSYLSASIDSILRIGNDWHAMLYLGDRYQWAALENGNIEPSFLTQVGFRQKLYRKKRFHYLEYLKLMESLLAYAENHGYPFARVWLDELQIKKGEIKAKIFMDKGPLILFEGIRLIGNKHSDEEHPNISANYMEHYLGIHKGNLYSKAQIKKIKTRIKELPFVQARQNATVTFRGRSAIVNLFLKKRKSSRFDIVFGLLPNNVVSLPGSPEVKRFLLTGTLDLDLHNQFGAGEKIRIAIEQIRPQTQELETHFLYPYVLNFPFGFDGNFLLYKKDTTHLDVNYDLGIQYQMEGGNYLKAFWSNTSSTLLAINLAQIKQQRKLPANLDFSNASFGLEY
ncbi:MAG TPA: hypothetical protein ENJ45_00980, partial [Phaeodactylibacter sp.]|nr:hypothetical protein [Phaeodactylibacter sp.]